MGRARLAARRRRGLRARRDRGPSAAPTRATSSRAVRACGPVDRAHRRVGRLRPPAPYGRRADARRRATSTRSSRSPRRSPRRRQRSTNVVRVGLDPGVGHRGRRRPGQGRRSRGSRTSSRRKAAQWQPASADECFEIVRRRLFEPMRREQARVRDGVIQAFGEMYRDASAASSRPRCAEAEYRRRMELSYPIHPGAVRPALRGLVDARQVPAHPWRAAADGVGHLTSSGSATTRAC